MEKRATRAGRFWRFFCRLFRSVISAVSGSDGRGVVYDYSTKADVVLPTHWVTLAHAQYGDGTQASYSYCVNWAGQRPLLRDSDDPRGQGKARRRGLTRLQREKILSR